MRPGEWVQLLSVALLALAAWLRPLERISRVRATLLALVAICIIAAARFSGKWAGPFVSSVVRDWVPAALMLVPYWQVGQFFTMPDRGIEARLAKFDRVFFERVGIKPKQTQISSALAGFLQLAYLLVYPLVPAALVVLYSTGMHASVDFYWLVVLSATNVCFVLTLFIPALPPRMLPKYEMFQFPFTQLGAINLRILDRGSIQAITCPSAHVATSVATALVFLRLEPWVGAVFLCIAISIAVATILGGYHYVADVILAAAVASAIFTAILCIQLMTR